MAQYINKSAVVAEIKKRLSLLESGTGNPEVMKRVEGVIKGYKSILSFLDTLEAKEDLETFDKEVTKMWGRCAAEPNDTIACLHIDSFIEIARHFYELGRSYWQKDNFWKPADGDDLPEIDREVVVLYQQYPLDVNEYSVGFAHRPPEYWDGKNIGTGVVTRYYPKKYGKGGWSSPDVKWWLDLDLPKPKVEDKL